MADSEYKVKIVVTTTDKTSAPAKKAAKGMGVLKQAAVATAVAFAAIKAAKVVAELAKVGATAQRQERALESLAQAADTSSDAIIGSIQEASQFTISKMDAMAAANRAMVMDVAKSPEEFERLTKVAVALGRAMGQDATKSIDDFVTASARQSQMIADNLGLTVTVGQATERYAKANNIAADSMTDAQKKGAFLNMMLEEGEKKMLELGDGSLDSAGKIEQASAAWDDTKTAVGQATLAIVEASGALGLITRVVQEASGELNRIAQEGITVNDVLGAIVATQGTAAASSWDYAMSLTAQAEAAQEAKIAAQDSSLGAQQYAQAIGQAQAAQDDAAFAAHNLQQSEELLAVTVGDTSAASWNQYQAALDAATKQQDDAAWSALELAKAEQDAATAAANAATMRLGLSISFTRQLDSMQESAAQFATDRETIEAEHQEKVVALQAKGAARSVQINVGAEQEKLAKLKFSRDQAQLKIDEMTGKERQSSQNAKQQALVTAQQRYDEQQALLEDYSAGRLVTAGQNVTALIAEENRRKDAAIAALDEQMAKQQEVQDQAMGQMMLQAFDQWGQQKDIPVEKMIEMRTAIAEEYGLVSAGATELVTDMVGEWDAWASDTKVSTDEVIKYMGNVIDETGEVRRNLLDMTASDYVIKVRYELSGQILDPETGQPTNVKKPKKQGEPEEFAAGGSFMVGEAGAEMVTIQPVGRGENAVYNDTFNVYDGNSMAAVQENRRRQRRGGIARTM